jgi:hypothetical protein
MNGTAATAWIVFLSIWFALDTTLHVLACVKRKRLLRGHHRERHLFLHACFDELLADYLTHNGTATPSRTPIADLMIWSHGQTIEPTEARR